MKLFQKISSKKHFWPIIIVIFFAVLAGRTLIFQKGYFNMHDDLQMMRQLEMEKCFIDKQIPCRWVPDMGYGFGFPLFNFYPPLPYLVGEIFRIVGFSFVETAKLLFALSFIVSGITMYLLSKEFFGKLGGVISSVFYIWAPYHSVDVYVRGAMNEAWALVWFPLILWTSYRLIKEKKKVVPWVIGLALSWFALFTSHNLMVLIFIPVFAFWCLFFLWRKEKWNQIPRLVVSGLLALGLAAFFTLPAVFEQKYVQINTLIVGYYEYIAHFATVNQLLFSRFWGYGASVWEKADKMPFQVGHFHWILSIVVGGCAVYALIKGKREKKRVGNLDTLFIVIFFFLAGWFATFMAHNKSTFIWQLLPPLKFVQFPWRFVTLSTFSFSFISGFAVTLLPRKYNPARKKQMAVLLVLSLVIFNWGYFLPEHGKMGALTDQEKFSGAAWDLQRTAGIFDYLPKSAKQNPREGQTVLAEIIEGEGEIISPQQGTNWASFDTTVDSDTALIRIGIYKYPVWKISIDGEEVEDFIPEEEMWGRMHIEIPKGEHRVYARLHNTPIRTTSNIISLVFWLGLLSFPLWKQKVLQFSRGNRKSGPSRSDRGDYA